jgi:hypothetical protein
MLDTLTEIRFDLPQTGNLDVKWIHGSVSAKHNQDPDIQVHFGVVA